MAPLLELDRVHVAYGPIEVLRGVDLRVPARSVVALVGPNGVGKTTTLRAIAGQLRPSRGHIRFEGRRIDGDRPWSIVRSGITLVPEGRGVFPALSVRDTIRLVAETVRAPAARVDEVYSLFPRLAERADQLAGTLSGGEQQMLALSRAFLARPKLLLIDELSTGLAPVVVAQLYERLAELCRTGVTVLLVEQYLTYVLDLADVCYEMAKGAIAFVGEPAELDARDGLLGLPP